MASAGGFAVVERTVDHPMVDPALFRERAFSIAVALGVIFNFCLYGSIFCLAIDLHRAHGLDALQTGLALLPMTIVTGAMAFLSGRLVSHIGEWTAIVVGLTAGAAGALLISVAATGGVTTLIVSSVPLGVTALAMPAMTAVAMSHAPRDRIGLASGVFNASRQTGGALGVAVLGALLVGGSGYVSLHAAFLAIAGAYAGGVALALIRPNDGRGAAIVSRCGSCAGSHVAWSCAARGGRQSGSASRRSHEARAHRGGRRRRGSPATSTRAAWGRVPTGSGGLAARDAR